MRKIIVFLFLNVFAVITLAQQTPPPRKTLELSEGKAADYPQGSFTDSWELVKK